MFKKEKLKSIFKEVLFTLIALFLAMNVISYIRAPQLSTEALEPLTRELIDNSTFSTHEIQGKPLLIHFWATWCPTCKLEAGNIQKISQHFNVISIAVKSGNHSEISEYMKTNKYDFKVINDANGELASQFSVPAFPTTFIYNAQGDLEFTEVGYSSIIGLYLRMWWAQ
jgi:thiol-disulfide isomerase/thioredoxin